MRSILRLIPRPYRTGLTRVIIALLICGVLYAMLSTKPSTVGKGKSDDHRFQFDYDVKDDVYYEPADNLNQAVPPAQHRGAEYEQPGGNFTKDNMYASQPVEFYTEDELAPLFERPKVDPSAPGEYGKAYKVTDNSAEVKKLVKEGWDKHAFNHYVCQKISLHRSVGDKRDQECKVRKWRKPLPDTSVIIIFHNEAWCALLRTVHSVLENSPKILLKEIILVDDASTLSNLGKELTDYVAKLQIVKIIRLPSRAGLIRARLAGAQEAQGSVLTFLDSHCECAPHWLEPMLERIAEDNTRVVCPVIEVIDADTFAMSLTTARNVPLGAFGWGLEFHWETQPGNKGMSIQTHERDDAFTTPVMAGAAFTMDREYFYRLGAYDPDMDGIGSENLEISFRVWLCGGSVEITPCSRVGHIGRIRKPYSQDEELNNIVYNKMRIAELWMDEYKWMFYRRTPKARGIELPNVDERKQLHEDLQCGNFEWYMHEVFPDLYVVQNKDLILTGEIRCSTNEEFCLDSNNVHGNPGSILDVGKCKGIGKGQYFELTEQSEIRQNTIAELCLAAKGKEVWTERCRHPWHDVTESQKWIFLPDGHIYHPDTNLCLTYNIHHLSVALLKCVKQGTSQIWVFGHKDGYQEDYQVDMNANYTMDGLTANYTDQEVAYESTDQVEVI
ncbi:polypeptide N-acetylgalactosaminyltransferase 4 isoform X1 [Ciona intestinalis]